jgi:hypothetical protein
VQLSINFQKADGNGIQLCAFRWSRCMAESISSVGTILEAPFC